MTSPVALLVAILALVVSAAGVGYAAGQIGTKQIKNKAITTKKIKNNAVTAQKIKADAVTADKIPNGSLGVAELAPNEVEHVATLLNGGEFDCFWQSGTAIISTLNAVSYRKDRFGTVHLAGVLQGTDGLGGDLSCNSGDVGQASDAIVFMLPAGYVPTKTRIFGSLGTGGVIVVGAQGISQGGLTLPAGAVAASPDTILLDGIEFDAAATGTSLPKVAAKGQVSGGLLKQLLG